MEITVQNYRQLRNAFDTSKLSKEVLDVFNDVDADFEDYLELYTDSSPENDGIRDVVNNHIKLVNKYFVNEKPTEIKPPKPADEKEKFNLLATFAGGVTVISNKNKEVNRDYEKIAHIFTNGDIKYFIKNLPKEVTDYCESYAKINQKDKPAAVKEALKPLKPVVIGQAFFMSKNTSFIMPKAQQLAVMESGKGEEKEFFIDKILEFETVFEQAKKRQDNVPLMDKIVRAHFFYGETDWYIIDYDTEDEFYGYVILNGDTQMAEAGYISIAELKTIKGIELDFYWDQKELGKVLHSRYPDEYPVYKKVNAATKDIYIVKDGKVLSNYGMKDWSFTDNPEFAHSIEDIAFANRMKKEYDAEIVIGFDLMRSEIENYVKPTAKGASKTKAPAKAKAPAKVKVAKVIDKTFVDNKSPEFLLISRFWNIIKSETVVIPFRKVQLLYMAFNKAAVERKVRKTSQAAAMFTECNKKIVVLFEEFAKPTQADVKVDFSDKKLYEQIKEYVTDVAVNPAVLLLNRFIPMQNATPDKAKAKTLHNAILRFLANDNNSSNRLLKEIKLAKASLLDYVEGRDDKVDLSYYGLSRPNICKNRVKCTGIDKTGKLHKGYKFQERTGNVIKVRRTATKRRTTASTKKPVAKKKK